MFNNPKDPSLKVLTDPGRELCTRFAKEANGFSREDVLSAALNIIVNVIRQEQNTGQKAEARFDELFGKTKTLLVSHYDSLGRKRGLFPYDQVIEVPKGILNQKN